MKLLKTRDRALSFSEVSSSFPVSASFSIDFDLLFLGGTETSTSSMVPLRPDRVTTPEALAPEKEEEGAATAEVGEGRDGLQERRIWS